MKPIFYKVIVAFCLVTGGSTFSFGQFVPLDSSTFMQIIEGVNQTFKQSNFYYEARNTVFGSHDGRDTVQSFVSFMYMNEKNKHLEQQYAGIYTLQNGDLLVRCDTSSKLLVLTNGVEKISSALPDFQHKTFFKLVEKIEIQEDVKGCVIRISYAEGFKFQRMELALNPKRELSGYKIWVSVTDEEWGGEIVTENARLEVEFTNITFGTIPKHFKPASIADFVVIDDVVKAAPRYADYELVDFRKN